MFYFTCDRSFTGRLSLEGDTIYIHEEFPTAITSSLGATESPDDVVAIRDVGGDPAGDVITFWV